jgi:hypothetical protein
MFEEELDQIPPGNRIDIGMDQWERLLSKAGRIALGIHPQLILNGVMTFVEGA